jgi:hypothetical protein
MLSISRDEGRRIVEADTFGRAWSIAEAGSSLLRRRMLTPADLPGEIAGARRVLARLKKCWLSSGEHVDSKQLAPVLPNDFCGGGDRIDEEFGGLVAA